MNAEDLCVVGKENMFDESPCTNIGKDYFLYI